MKTKQIFSKKLIRTMIEYLLLVSQIGLFLGLSLKFNLSEIHHLLSLNLGLSLKLGLNLDLALKLSLSLKPTQLLFQFSQILLN